MTPNDRGEAGAGRRLVQSRNFCRTADDVHRPDVVIIAVADGHKPRHERASQDSPHVGVVVQFDERGLYFILNRFRQSRVDRDWLNRRWTKAGDNTKFVFQIRLTAKRHRQRMTIDRRCIHRAGSHPLDGFLMPSRPNHLAKKSPRFTELRQPIARDTVTRL